MTFREGWRYANRGRKPEFVDQDRDSAETVDRGQPERGHQ